MTVSTMNPAPQQGSFIIDLMRVDECYNLREELGHGSYALVRKGIDKRDKSPYAIKMIHSPRSEKFTPEKEAEMMMLVHDHTHIISLHRSLRCERHFCLVQDLAHGSLFDYVTKRQSFGELLSELEIGAIIAQVLDGLSHMHTRGVSHRDIKLANILLLHDDSQMAAPHVLLADFGHATTDSTSDEFCGSLHYMAPEIVRHETYNTRAADIYACGVVLFAMLAGTLPYDSHADTTTRKMILAGNVEELIQSGRLDGVSDEGIELVRSMMSVNASSRPSASELLSHPFITSALDLLPTSARK